MSWWRHQMETFSPLLALCAGNSLVPGEFPAQRPVMETLMFSLICVWINDWINNREAADLRCYDAHYDVIVMVRSCLFRWISRLAVSSMPNVVTFLIFDVDLLLNIARDWSAKSYVMMTSSNGNIFCVTGPLCGEFTGSRWIPRTKASDAELWCFLWSASELTIE